jgi:hypothetical protein
MTQTKPISGVRASEIRPKEVLFKAEKGDWVSLLEDGQLRRKLRWKTSLRCVMIATDQ